MLNLPKGVELAVELEDVLNVEPKDVLFDDSDRTPENIARWTPVEPATDEELELWFSPEGWAEISKDW